MKTLLHVGCGKNRKDRTTPYFNSPDWSELRLDIDVTVEPDIVGSMLDMSAVPDASVDAVFSSHNIEHLYPHEVPLALAEFKRVLRPDGIVFITCPDLQSVGALLAEDKLTDPAYQSPAGPVTPLDMLYGFRTALQAGNLYMAHRCGFTEKTLRVTLADAGFARRATCRRTIPPYDLFAIATKGPLTDEELLNLAKANFPS